MKYSQCLSVKYTRLLFHVVQATSYNSRTLPAAGTEFCKTLHIMDSTGNSVVVNKHCAFAEECRPDLVGCLEEDRQSVSNQTSGCGIGVARQGLFMCM